MQYIWKITRTKEMPDINERKDNIALLLIPSVLGIFVHNIIANTGNTACIADTPNMISVTDEPMLSGTSETEAAIEPETDVSELQQESATEYF